jgi:hypothetical protein
MSNNDRGQFLEILRVSFPGGEQTVTLPRPTTLLPALNNNKDHTTEPMSRDEFRAGRGIVEFAATLDIPGVLIKRIELVRGTEGFAPNSPNFGGSNQGTNVIGTDEVGPTPGALFPNGSLGVGEPEVLFEDATGLPLGATIDLNAGDGPDAIHRLLANIPIEAHQSIRILFDNTGGALNNQLISTTYDTGLAAVNYSLQGFL